MTSTLHVSYNTIIRPYFTLQIETLEDHFVSKAVKIQYRKNSSFLQAEKGLTSSQARIHRHLN